MALNKDHIHRVFSQKFSLKDYKKLINYFKDEDLNEETKLVIQNQWDQFKTEETASNLDSVFNKLFINIKDIESRTIRRLQIFSRIAAVLIIGMFIAAGFYFSQRPETSIPDQKVEFVSNTGFRNQFKLPDGTSGWLGQGSNLKYSIQKGIRIVELDGLAYFDVVHNEKVPFIVKTPSKLDVRVLGTRFNVLSYSSEKICEVVLEQGSVSLNLNNKEVGKLQPNQKVVFDILNKSIQKSNVEVTDYLAWKDGLLVLKDVSFAEACDKLSRFYNVDIEMQTNGLDDQKVRLILENELLNDALELLSMLVPIKYQINSPTLESNNLTRKKVIFKNK